MTQPTPPRGDAPEILLARSVVADFVGLDKAPESWPRHIRYIPEALAEKRIAEARAQGMVEAFDRSIISVRDRAEKYGMEPALRIAIINSLKEKRDSAARSEKP